MKKFFGLFGGEEAVILTAEEELQIISNKAQDAYDFGGADAGESKFVVGTDGYDVEEIAADDVVKFLEEARKTATIDRLLADPSIKLKLEDGQHVVEAGADESDPWGRVNSKGRISGGG